jgi:hypothetical protein
MRMACVVHNDKGFPNPAAVSVNGMLIPGGAIARKTLNCSAAETDHRLAGARTGSRLFQPRALTWLSGR